jgi:HAD superfamily hydrolase (TIGR01509 family)
MKKAIIFDMDGVLFDTEIMSSKAWLQLSKERNLGNIEQLTTDCIGRNRTDIILQFRKKFGDSFDAEEFLSTGRALMQSWIDRDGLPLMKGCVEILQYLNENGYIVGVASSSSTKTILSHMEKAGLKSYFQAIIGGDQVTLSKPKPDIYLKACEAIHMPPEEVMAVEDSPNGIRSAYAAGMKPIMIPDLVEPDEEISDLLYRKYDSLLELKKAMEMGCLS